MLTHNNTWDSLYSGEWDISTVRLPSLSERMPIAVKTLNTVDKPNHFLPNTISRYVTKVLQPTPTSMSKTTCEPSVLQGTVSRITENMCEGNNPNECDFVSLKMCLASFE